MFDGIENKIKVQKKITKKRLENIALYYLKRFESSIENLRSVLKRRVDKYAFSNQEFNKIEAYGWIDEIVLKLEGLKYIDDERYADIKIKSYITSGKSARYIQNKLKEKGIEADLVEDILYGQEYSPIEAALKTAKKKRIGPFRKSVEERNEFKQKDMQKLAQAGFDFEVISEILNMDFDI